MLCRRFSSGLAVILALGIQHKELHCLVLVGNQSKLLEVVKIFSRLLLGVVVVVVVVVVVGEVCILLDWWW